MFNIFINKHKNLSLFLAGLLSSLAFAPTYFFVVMFFTFPFLLNEIIKSKSYKQAIKVGFLFGSGYFCGSLYWICTSLFIDLKSYWYLIPICIICSAIFPSIYIMFTTLSTYLVKKVINHKFALVVIFSAFFIIFEWLRGILFTGLPWNILVSSLAFSSFLLQPISFLNCYTYGFIILIIYCAKLYYKTNYFFVMLGIFILTLLYSTYRFNSVDKGYLPQNIRLVQGNTELNQIWDNNNLKNSLDNLITLSKSKGYENIDYFIWAEGAVPYYIDLDNDNYSELLEYLNNNLLNNEKTLITGIDIKKNNKYYNSMIVIKGKNIIDYYHKQHLVPFGEFIPFRNILPFVDIVASGMSDFSKGKKNKTINDNILPVFSPNICYESIFYDSINKDTKLIVNITNDAWFGTTSGPFQHFDNLKLRAIENSIPAIRVGNSGISGVINALGVVEIKSKLNKKTYLDIKIPNNKITKINRIPEFCTIICLAFILLVVLLIDKMQKKYN